MTERAGGDVSEEIRPPQLPCRTSARYLWRVALQLAIVAVLLSAPVWRGSPLLSPLEAVGLVVGSVVLILWLNSMVGKNPLRPTTFYSDRVEQWMPRRTIRFDAIRWVTLLDDKFVFAKMNDDRTLFFPLVRLPRRERQAFVDWLGTRIGAAVFE